MSQSPLDTPEGRRRLVRALLFASPIGFAVAYVVAAVQGADPQLRLLLAGITLAGGLGAALLFHLAGSNARYALIAFSILRMFMRK